MEHLYYLFCLLALMAAAAILTLGFRQAIQTGNRPLGIFLIFYAVFSLQIMGSLIGRYLLENLADQTQPILPAIILISQLLYCALLWSIACLPLFLHDLGWRRQGALGFGLLYVGYAWICLAGVRWLPDDQAYQIEPYLAWLWIPVLLGTNLWAIMCGLICHRQADPRAKEIQSRILPLVALFLPAWLADYFWHGMVAIFVVPALHTVLSVALLISIRQCETKRLDKSSKTGLVEKAASWGLSQRELEVLAMILSGQRNQQIATALFISPNTVKTHIKSILRKTKANSRFELLCRLSPPAAGRN